MLYWLDTTAHGLAHGLQCLLVPDVARDSRDGDGARRSRSSSGRAMIARLSRYQIGQVVRDDGPKSHLPKAGTPTMGGALILRRDSRRHAAVGRLSNRFVWTVLGVTFAFGLIGFYDDYLKLVVGNSKGLAARWKYFWQSVAGLGDRGDALLHGADARRRRRCSCPSSRTSPRRSRRSASSRSRI